MHRNNPEHILYVTGDVDAPDCIKDRNGEVVLDLCKVCGRGEIELEESCDDDGPSLYNSMRAALRELIEAIDEQGEELDPTVRFVKALADARSWVE